MLDDFTQELHPRWSQTCLGPGTIALHESILRMALPEVQQGTYADAQIDDYGKLARKDFPWQPPLRMEVRARTSHPSATPASTAHDSRMLRGTAGFGFWNYPFSVRGDILMLPEAIWFFYASPPSNMALVPGLPGWGWKAQVVHSMRPGALLATIPTALATGLALTTGRTRPASRWLQRLSGTQEALLNTNLLEWHTYVLEWHANAVLFWVDDEPILRAPNPPTRPLGFVAWLDNQYAIATPRGVLRFGTVSSGPQWLELDSVRIDPL
ncbi:hypothetical protein [Ktedonospora formicarum]|uniref:GH16 domain-containing protein n=1 Tax=Ktedonospora formicarum TaxID=2778364 RepID=A0A8J3MW86_9CHLR|nr:hypothetical protein [Ktedonospora formicarum]GHO50095.1 hypothetical protein KSX_82580 [Ktedonospora formicarum]